MAAGLAQIAGGLEGKVGPVSAFAAGSWQCSDPRSKRRARACRKRGDLRCRLEKRNGPGDDPRRDPIQKRPRWLLVAAGCVAAVAAVGIFRYKPDGLSGGNRGNAGGNSGGGGENSGSGGGGRGNPRKGGAGRVVDEEEEGEKPQKIRVLASLSSAAVESLDPKKIEDLESVQRFKGQASFNFETNKFNVQVKSDDDDQKGSAQPGREKLELSKSKENLNLNERISPQLSKPSSNQTIPPPKETEHVDKDGKDQGRSLTGMIDSALAQAGVKHKRVMRAEERKEYAKEIAASVLEQIGGDDSLAKKSETGALKRLQQEAFTDIMKARERIDKVELGVAELKKSVGSDRTSLKARVAAGGAFVLMQDQSSLSSRSALEQCGLPAGLDVDFTFQTPFREADLLITKCVAGEGGSSSRSLGGAIRLQKVHYVAQVSEDIKVSFAPLGAEAKDMTSTVNPVQDDALTRFSRTGPPLFDYCRGSAIGAAYQTASTLLSVSQHLSGWGEGAASDPVCLSTLAQAVHQPLEQLVLSLSALNRVWPSPPLPSTPGLHWSEMGPLVFSSTSASASSSTSAADILGSSDWRSSAEAPAFQPKGTSMQSLALSAEVKLGDVATLGGWFQVERGDWLVQQEQKQPQWCLSLIKSASEDISGGVCVGNSRRDYLSSVKDDETSSPQLQVEAFLKLDCGQGLWLQPGLVYVINKQCHTPGLMLKAEWKL